MTYVHYYHSPIGELKITAEENCITGLCLCTEEVPNMEKVQKAPSPCAPLLQQTCQELTEYFAGSHHLFRPD